MKYLAIDLGSTFLKGAVLDLDRCSRGVTQRVPMPEPVGGVETAFFEISPHALCDAVCSLLDQLLGQAPDAEGLLMCAQMHGMVLVNAHGEPRSNAITWQDQRGALPVPGEGAVSYVDWLASRLPPKLQVALGNELRPGNPIATLAWLAREGDLPAGELNVVSLPDYVLSRLSRQRAVVDATNAASYGLFDVERGVWSNEAIALCGLERFRLPRVLAEDEPAPYLFEHKGKSLRCQMPVGDHQCALLGSFLRRNELSVNVATGSQVSALFDKFHAGRCQVRPFFDRLFLHTVTHIPAGRSLDVVMRLICELSLRAGTPVHDPWEHVRCAVEQTESTDLKVDLSFFKNRDTKPGSVQNIGEHNFTIGHLFRAALERMADDYCHYSEALPSPEHGWQRLVFSGGIAHSAPLLRELIQTRLGVPCRMCPSGEDTMNGLLVLGLRASGRSNCLEAAMDTVEAHEEEFSK